MRQAAAQLLNRWGETFGSRDARSATVTELPAAGIRNAQELQVFGLRRSGNHAVIAWIAQQYNNPIVFLNNARPFQDPFTTYLMGRVPNALPVRKLNAEETETLRRQPKNLLLLSYEDVNIRRLAKVDLLPDRQAWLGNSGSQHRILLLRDFYNWIASRVRLFENKGRATEDLVPKIEAQIRLWIMYAREFVEETKHLGDHDTVPVRFDRWSNDDAYRLEILRRLNIPVLNNACSVVPRAGGGSSFDGTRFSGSAEEMDVLNRWRYLEAPEHGALLCLLSQRRREIEEYNQKIFGMEYPFTSLSS
jgi:hypothetical protein